VPLTEDHAVRIKELTVPPGAPDAPRWGRDKRRWPFPQQLDIGGVEATFVGLCAAGVLTVSVFVIAHWLIATTVVAFVFAVLQTLRNRSRRS
jgi:hypothetical protein